MPLELSFDEIPFFNSIIYQVFDNCIDVLFMIDMSLMFYTSFRNKFGIEVFIPRQIAINYVSSPRFYTDLASVLGTGIVTQWVPNSKIFKCFKIVRIFRVKVFI